MVSVLPPPTGSIAMISDLRCSEPRPAPAQDSREQDRCRAFDVSCERLSFASTSKLVGQRSTP
jgi:hypothetical protein